MLKKSLETIFTFNNSYQTIATGGLFAATYTVGSGLLGYPVHPLTSLILTYAIGFLALVLTRLNAAYNLHKNNSQGTNNEENEIEGTASPAMDIRI